MPTCPACGSTIRETDRVCRGCGALTGVQAKSKPYASLSSLIAAIAVGLIAVMIVRWLGYLP